MPDECAGPIFQSESQKQTFPKYLPDFNFSVISLYSIQLLKR